MELNKKVRVNILHVESPHKFYFRKYSDAVDIDSKIKGYVDAYGVSSSGAIPKLKDQPLLKLETQSIYIGSICGVVPAEEEHNNSVAWSRESTDFFKNMVKITSHVYFCPKHYSDNCYYGDIEYVQKKDLATMLIDLEHARRVDDRIEYSNGIETESTTNEDEVDEINAIKDYSCDVRPVINYNCFTSSKRTKHENLMNKMINGWNTSSFGGNYVDMKNAQYESQQNSRKQLTPITERTENSSVENDHSENPFDEDTFSESLTQMSFGSEECVDKLDDSNLFDQTELFTTPIEQLNKEVAKSENDDQNDINQMENSCDDKSIDLIDLRDSNSNIFNSLDLNGDTLPKAKTFEGLSNLESQNENNIEQIDTVKVPIDKNVSLLINEPESQIDEHIPTVQFPPLDPLESMKYSQSIFDLSNVCISDSSSVPSYLWEPSDSEPDADQYQEFIGEVEKGRNVGLEELKQQAIKGLLHDAKLFDSEPITNNNEKFDRIESCKVADHTLDKMYPIQNYVWPHILNNESAILIGDTEFYAHLLYLPAICGFVEQFDSKGVDGPKVVILATNQQMAIDIDRISRFYLGEPLYENSMVVNSDISRNSNNRVTHLQRCKIFVTLLQKIYVDPSEMEELKSVKYVVINNIESITSEHRQFVLQMIRKLNTQFIITSNYFIEELTQLAIFPNVFISTESHFDLFHLTMDEDDRSTHIMQTNRKKLQLRKKLISITNSESHNHVAVVCSTREIATKLSYELKTIYRLENTLNQKPSKGMNVLVCSDDHLTSVGVRTAHHIIHYDLPDDFATFSLRYSLISSCCTFQARNSMCERGPAPTSTILFSISDQCSYNVMLTLLSREYALDVSERGKFLKIARDMNAEAPICVDIAANFTNIGHMLKCHDRHFIRPEQIQLKPRLSDACQLQVEILRVLSPISFVVRIQKFKNSNGDWCDLDSSDQFRIFCDELNKFYDKSFVALQAIADINVDSLYILRHRYQYSRCKILDKTVENGDGKVRVNLVDFGEPRLATVCDIGQLDESHQEFPYQTVNLNLLMLTPWNQTSWDANDINFLSNFLLGASEENSFGDGRYEISIECEMWPDKIFAKNLMSLTGGTHEYSDYVNYLISQGIACKNDNNVNEFFEHAKDANVLIENP